MSSTTVFSPVSPAVYTHTHRYLNTYSDFDLECVIKCVGFEDETLEMVVAALEDLRNALRDKGTNLMVRFGKAENVIQEIVEKVVNFL